MNNIEKTFSALPMIGRLMMAAIFLVNGFAKAAAPQMIMRQSVCLFRHWDWRSP